MGQTHQELFEQMKTLFNEFETQHNKPTKSSQTKARKAIGELKKMITEYRKASVDASK